MPIWINFPSIDDTIRFLVEVKHAGNLEEGDFAMAKYMDKLGERGLQGAVGLVIAGGDVSVVETNPETGQMEPCRSYQLLSNEFIEFLHGFLD